jgi:Tfp pilus assembly protein PilF
MELHVTRIDGWKAIAHYLKRERTTVMRWARDRDMPVHRLPGNGSTSIFAYTEELDHWFARSRIDTEVEPQERKHFMLPRVAWLTGSALGATAAIAALVAWFSHRSPDSAPIALPHDPAVAALYIQARDDWASRTASGLHRAVDEFTTVVRRDPGFAPAHAGLADAYLLIREFDATPDAIAYPRAEASARRALALDRNSPAAHRALAFVAYWWRRDPATARTAFANAIRLDPNNAQTHFWFGNALVDNGQAAAGLHELEQARLLDPGSQAILADYGWALWTSGRHAEAKATLENLGRAGQSSSPYTYLAYIALLERDWPRYLDLSDRRAALRDDTVLVRRNAAERAAYNRGGAAAMLELMGRVTVSDPSSTVVDTSWPAALAGLAGDRTQVLRILQQADRRREVWGFSGFVRPALARWHNDPAIGPLLRRRAGESLLTEE